MPIFIAQLAVIPIPIARAAVIAGTPLATLRVIEIVSASTSVSPSTAPVASRPPSPNRFLTSATPNSTI
jgi:hypothetical protein